MNRLKTVTDWLSNTTTYTYDADGNLVGAVNPNGTASTYGYDAANRLIALTNSAPNSTIISAYAYTLDPVGNHSKVDQVEQLQTTPIVGQFAYSYDPDNRMITSEGQAQTFDANGNMISIDPTNTLAYDFENRLTQMAFDNGTNTFQYSGLGSRMSATRSGAVTRYVLDVNSPLTQVLSETDSNGIAIAYYVYGLGLVSKIDSGGNAQYYHFDSRGSTIALTGASGQITEAYAYDPFGRPINGILSPNRFRYLGRHGVMDEENGFLYIRARYYSTRRGRFTTKDPTTGKDGDSQSLNRYVYALNNPVRLIDISGLSAQEGSTAPASANTTDLLHQNYISSDANANLAYSVLQSLVKNGQEELVEEAIEAYLKSNSGSVASSLGMTASSVSQAIGFGVPLGGIAYDVVLGYVQDRENYPNRGGLEEGARIGIDLAEAAVVAIPTAALVVAGAPVVAVAGVGIAIGVAADVYSEPIQNAAYSAESWYVNTVPSAIENTYMNGINAIRCDP
jgi:RHS repeat-associated protein